MRTAAAALLLALFMALVPSSASAAGGDISSNCTPAPANCSGWYTVAVTIHFAILPNPGNSVSNPIGCSDFTQGSDTTDVAQTCTATMTDTLGGSTTLSATAHVKKDGTPPTNVHANAPGGASSGGWYRSPVAVEFTGNDATSGIATCSSFGYSGPDATGVSFNGSCTDNAGNGSGTVASPTIKYDATPPVATGGNTSRSPDSNGWFNHSVGISFLGTDNLSGIASCTSIPSYTGPDTNGMVAGSCTDNAGNIGVTQVPFKYDGTPPNVSAQPGRGADGNGWFNHPVTVLFNGNDAASGIASCTSAPYSGPDTAGTSITGSCTDVAGNAAGASYSLKYDSTPPSATAANATRGPDVSGWYNHPFSIAFAGADGLSGIDSCSTVAYSGPDSGSATATGTCLDHAGNTSAPFVMSFSYDGTGPVVSGRPSRAPDSNGWYNHAVDISFVGNDGSGSGVDSCSSGSYGGPDAAGVSLNGSCTDRAGNVGSAGFGVNYDTMPPTGITGALSRPPDHDGWYNNPVQVAFSGTDATSGGVSCTSTNYTGPDTDAASVAGTCRDAAGNGASGGAVTFKYKSTPPSITNVGVGVNNDLVSLNWKLSPDAKDFQIVRTPGTESAGPSVVETGIATSFVDRNVSNGATYEYALTATDEAGNTAVQKITVVPAAALFSPASGVTVTTAPLLAWRTFAGASYYNVQVVYLGRRGLASGAKGRKVLSAWPVQPRYRLKKSWVYNKHKFKLVPGTYRWYVWPGYGKRTARKYGPLLGQSQFFFAKP